jgi:hypothetical protein
MVKHHRWQSYYWAFIKQSGKECWKTWRGEVLASAITLFCVYLLNRSSIDLWTGSKATAYTVGAFVLWHTIRVPWILHEKIDEAEHLNPSWGLLGLLFLAGTFLLLAYTAAWFYTVQPKVVLDIAPSAERKRLLDLNAEVNGLQPFKESTNSLRRRTIRLAAQLDTFWSEVPPPPGGPPSNPVTDEDKKRVEAWDKYWRDIRARYDSHSFREKILEIVKQFQSKGVPTGYLEPSARDRMIGGPYFPGLEFSPAQVLCQSEICQLRELAFHVNASDEVITPDF